MPPSTNQMFSLPHHFVRITALTTMTANWAWTALIGVLYLGCTLANHSGSAPVRAIE